MHHPRQFMLTGVLHCIRVCCMSRHLVPLHHHPHPVFGDFCGNILVESVVYLGMMVVFRKDILCVPEHSCRYQRYFSKVQPEGTEGNKCNIMTWYKFQALKIPSNLSRQLSASPAFVNPCCALVSVVRLWEPWPWVAWCAFGR